MSKITWETLDDFEKYNYTIKQPQLAKAIKRKRSKGGR